MVAQVSNRSDRVGSIILLTSILGRYTLYSHGHFADLTPLL